MKVVLQRVLESFVEVDSQKVGSINRGLMLLVGVEDSDEGEDVDWLVRKILNMRIFSDSFGKLNCSILEVGGEILAISQFTLIADYKKGNRPSFIRAAGAEKGQKLYEDFCQKLKEISRLKVEKGVFGADMKVSLINDGPVTIVLDSKTKN